MVTLADLGILRDVDEDGDAVVVTITPTYSGCPAMREISDDLRAPAARGRASPTSPCGPSSRRRGPATGSPPRTAQARRGRHRAAEPGAAGAPGPIPLTLTARAAPCAARAAAPRTRRETSAFSAHRVQGALPLPRCAEPFEHVKEI